MIRFVLLPIDHIDIYRGPKYLKWRMNPTGIDCQWSMKDYGSIDTAIVAINATQPQINDLLSNLDVFGIPENLDLNPSPQELTTLTNYLEAVFVPADWLTPSATWRVNIRTITGMYLFMQRLSAIAGDPLAWGVSLNTQFRNLPVDKQSAILQTYSELGYDSGNIRDNWTMRVLLKDAADQWGTRVIFFGFTEL